MLYPNNIKKEYKHQVSHSNRGMNLESLLNETNNYYLENDIALIFKKPTPIGIAKVNYTAKGKMIEKAYFKERSTLDYNGLFNGKYIEFDAKETLNRTSFPLSNIHPHQINHIKKVLTHGGISFLIIKMNNSYFLLHGKDFITFLEENTRKSIPYEYIKEKGTKIEEKYNPSLDYLKIVDSYIKEVI